MRSGASRPILPGPLGKESCIRATAVGVVIGLIAAVDTVRLHEGLPPLTALGLSAFIVSVYIGVAWLALPGMAFLSHLGARVGGAPGALVSALVLWAISGAILCHAVLNETARTEKWLEAWKLPLRVSFVLAGIAAIVFALRRLQRAPRGTLLAERSAAVLALPALVGALIFVISANRTMRSAVTPDVAADSRRAADLIALTPRFVPEPPEAFEKLTREGAPYRVLLVGLDGASWDRIEAGIAAGRLPTFQRLVEGGAHSPLGSLYPTYSPAIWTSVVTGVAPEAHGIQDVYLTQLPGFEVENFRLRRALDLVEESLDGLGMLRRVPVTSSLRRHKAVWNLADEAGLEAGVMGLWATWPPEALKNGFVVSDHASLARRHEWISRGKSSVLTAGITTSPPELAQRLERYQRSPDSVTPEELGQFLPVDHKVWSEFGEARSFSKQVTLSAFRSSHLNDAFFLTAALELWRERSPDLLVVYAKAIDELSHFFYDASVPEAADFGWSQEEIRRYANVVDNTYAWTDRHLAPLIDAVDLDGRTLLIVVSDHGWEREPEGKYNHSNAPPGILILYGADVCRQGCPNVRDPGIFDIAPTILERLRLPISDELPGRPLLEAFAQPQDVVRVAEYGARLNPTQAVVSPIDFELTEKLEALGYME